jgi:shikimate kinase / 3-dehydroquinate synthase
VPPLHGKNIYLTGFMATGKSRVGKELAALLRRPFTDTDHMIEDQAGMTINEIFERLGEVAFRDMESQVVKEVSQRPNWVIALGGGAVIRSENWQAISSTGLIVCLTASLDTLASRVRRKNNRPLLENLSEQDLQKKINDMLTLRMPHYLKADYFFESLEEVSARELALTIHKRLME